MKNRLIIASLCFAFLSCGEIKEEDNIPTSKLEILTSLEDTEEDTAKKQTSAVEENNSSQRKGGAPILTARGSEPGWYVAFYTDHATLLLDYGKDSIIVDHDFSNITKDKTYTAKIANVNVKNGQTASQSLVVEIDSKPCTEASGETSEKSITLKYNNKTYKGCATVNNK